MRIALMSGAAWLAFGTLALAVLAIGQPAEDAYILFKYVENLGSGLGIVFYAGGPQTEGATDFLYMGMIAAMVRLGADVAVSAALVNAVGAAGIVAALLALGGRFRTADRDRARRVSFLTALWALSLFGSSAFLASYLGAFSPDWGASSISPTGLR